jgi:hypothetical protein
MTYHFWRLSEAGPDNLGLACADDGLLLGQTPLIERRDGRFVVRQRHEIERLLQCAYGGALAAYAGTKWGGDNIEVSTRA